MTFYLTIEAMWELPEPNSRKVAATTLGISRNMQADLIVPLDAPGLQQGGGNLNGTQATSILHGQSGTAAQRIALPRKPPNAGNYCGVV